MKQGKIRRLASEGARKERAGCPEWAEDKVMNFAQGQAAFIQNTMLTQMQVSPYTVASVGAFLLALSLVSFHRETCSDPECEDCVARNKIDPRHVARDVVEFYFRRAELDILPVQGNA